MPKQKTHSGTKDRIKITKSGKLHRRHATGTHFLQKKSASRKRRFAGTQAVAKSQVKPLKKKLGV